MVQRSSAPAARVGTMTARAAPSVPSRQSVEIVLRKSERLGTRNSRVRRGVITEPTVDDEVESESRIRPWPPASASRLQPRMRSMRATCRKSARRPDG